MELMDAASLRAIGAYLELDLAARGESYLLVQLDGAGSEHEAAAALTIIGGLGGDAELTMDPVEGERLLAIRRACHPALCAIGTTLIEDVAVPRSVLPEMFDAIREIGQRRGLSIPTVAHAGDGNLHPNFIFDGAIVPDAVWDAADEVFSAALALGGTLTGEHGVGILKKRWLQRELGDDQLALQRRIRAAFDPQGILNPGKVF
jgi:glycolate oxidase